MTRADALAELIAKVKVGDDKGFRAANRAVFSTPCQDVNLQLREENCRHAYKGSLDAALALHEAVLPWWTMDQMNQWHEDGTPRGWAVHLLRHKPFPKKRKQGFCRNTPARAWLLAILKALHEMEAEK